MTSRPARWIVTPESQLSSVPVKFFEEPATVAQAFAEIPLGVEWPFA